MFKRLLDFILFSSLFIAFCAVAMVHQTNDLFQLEYDKREFLSFVFFSTICSYNFHWYLTPDNYSELDRATWTVKNRWVNFFFIIIGLIGSVISFFKLKEHWPWLGIAGILTFLYSAPKIPWQFSSILKKIAIGKTIFLSLVWMYVTTILPVLISGQRFDRRHLLFAASRFFFIYAICIIFDYRDRDQDKRDGIRSLITYLDQHGIDILFYFSLIIFAITSIALFYYDVPIPVIISLIIPGIILLALYPSSKRNFSDYLYYFVLDGLMMLSALITSLLSI
jgi:4-hydroxybenzoate polyprenyltransferase